MVIMAIEHWTNFFRSLICSVLLLLVTDFPKEILASNILFSCSFTSNTCGMENQATAKWRREYLSIGGRQGHAMVVRGNEGGNHFARLLTPYISAQEVKTGCMRFLYYIEGRTPASIAVIKQGFVTQYLFGTAHRTGDHWERAELDVQFLGDKAMFYLEADTRVQDYGSSLVAFTDLSITKHSCRH